VLISQSFSSPPLALSTKNQISSFSYNQNICIQNFQKIYNEVLLNSEPLKAANVSVAHILVRSFLKLCWKCMWGSAVFWWFFCTINLFRYFLKYFWIRGNSITYEIRTPVNTRTCKAFFSRSNQIFWETKADVSRNVGLIKKLCGACWAHCEWSGWKRSAT
jgi:hypothetical protein